MASRLRSERRVVRAPRAKWGRAAALVALVVAPACAHGGAEPSRARMVLARAALSLYAGMWDTLSAVAYDPRGQVDTRPIFWFSDDPRIAAVDTHGVVVAYTPGRTTFRAMNGVVTRTVPVTVLADSTKPRIQLLELSTRTIDLVGGDAVLSVVAHARDSESGIRTMQASAAPAAPIVPWAVRLSCLMSLESGTRTNGTWRCSFPIHRYTMPGPWQLVVEATDWKPFLPNLDTSADTFTVANPRPDATTPTLTALTFTEERSDALAPAESRIMVISATDGESGMLTAEFVLDSAMSRGIYSCGAERSRARTVPWEPQPSLTGRCPIPLKESATPVLLTVAEVRLTDARGNVRVLTTADLAQRGFQTTIDVRK